MPDQTPGETPTRFRKRPVEVDAIQITRDTFGAAVRFIPIAQFAEAGEDHQGVFIGIRTLEGTMRASEGDWIIRGIANEFYPCKDEIFRATYEPVDGAQ